MNNYEARTADLVAEITRKLETKQGDIYLMVSTLFCNVNLAVREPKKARMEFIKLLIGTGYSTPMGTANDLFTVHFGSLEAWGIQDMRRINAKRRVYPQ